MLVCGALRKAFLLLVIKAQQEFLVMVIMFLYESVVVHYVA